MVGLTRGLLAGVPRIQADGAHTYVVIDTPPGHGDRGITRAALELADVGVIPISPRMLDADRLRATVGLLAEVAEVNPKLAPSCCSIRCGRAPP